jgi:DNA-binding HxlR family transcriptional regulator
LNYDGGVRSYGQHCSLAKALDVVGDRWSLLIIRELIARGACRYTDLREGLPGIATNMLADRLRDLEQAGIVSREDAPPPVARPLFRLTPRGEELRGVVRELTRWGLPLIGDSIDGEAFRGHWLAAAALLLLKDNAPDAAPVAIEVRAGEEPMLIVTAGGALQARPGPGVNPDAIISGTPRLTMGLLTGMLDIERAQALGLEISGDASAIERIRTPLPLVGAGAS